MADSLNEQVAARLQEVAQILNEQGANYYRIEAYRRAATMLTRLKRPVQEIVRAEGIEGLKRLPGVGETIARAIYQLVASGRLPMLDRLRGESDPVELLATVPGIGSVFAERLHHDLGIETLEELEAAAYDCRLAEIEGLGEKRLSGIRDTLATRLGRVRARPSAEPGAEPLVDEILDVDREYRTKAAAGSLKKIAPRRFNPTHEAWLPVLHTTRGGRHYTALYSNTACAHQMRKTNDWVVLYYDGGGGERQCTVITSTRGLLEGRRIVRGREPECAAHYFGPHGEAQEPNRGELRL